jgi:hypothetical protein
MSFKAKELTVSETNRCYILTFDLLPAKEGFRVPAQSATLTLYHDLKYYTRIDGRTGDRHLKEVDKKSCTVLRVISKLDRVFGDLLLV